MPGSAVIGVLPAEGAADITASNCAQLLPSRRQSAWAAAVVWGDVDLNIPTAAVRGNVVRVTGIGLVVQMSRASSPSGRSSFPSGRPSFWRDGMTPKPVRRPVRFRSPQRVDCGIPATPKLTFGRR